MIPELKSSDYDPDNSIPDKTTQTLTEAITAFETARLDSLLTGASKAYLKGAKVAYSRLEKKFVSSEVEDDVYAFLKTYKSQIEDGYTIIQGEKVYWLRDRTLAERQKIFDIISQGITEGKSPDKIKKEFKDYFGMQKSEAKRIARTETAYVQAQGRDDKYKKFGVKKVKWLLGKNSCARCQNYGGNVYTWDELPGSQPLHPSCTCDLAPVID